MSNQLVEAFFLVALWAPPLVVVAGALLLLVPDRSAHRVVVSHHTAPLTH